MGSVSRGFRLARASWTVVRGDRELLILPVVSFLCSLVVLAAFGRGCSASASRSRAQSVRPGIYVLGFCMYVALAFVTIFFNAAVIGTAMKRLKGEPASIRDGLALAREHIGKIFLWALITASVGMVLRAIQERSGSSAGSSLGIIGIAWSRDHVLRGAGAAVRAARRSVIRSAALRTIFRTSAGASSSSGNATIGIAIVLLVGPGRDRGRPADRGGSGRGHRVHRADDRRTDGGRFGVLGRLQRGALPVRDDGRLVGRVLGGGPERIVPAEEGLEVRGHVRWLGRRRPRRHHHGVRRTCPSARIGSGDPSSRPGPLARVPVHRPTRKG